MKICTAEQMRGLDTAAIETYGIPGLELMENAGRGTSEFINKRFGSPKGRVAAIFVGPGNNGGDGLVIARYLFQEGGKPEIFLLTEKEKITGDAAANLAAVEKLAIPITLLLTEDGFKAAETCLAECWLAVDAIFGTGLTREVTGHFRRAIDLINRASCPVVAVDIPSGLHTDTGLPLGVCIQADLTVTFGLAKIGQVVEPGRGYTGELAILDIGIPEAALQEADIRSELLEKQQVARWLPVRPAASHKGTYGHLLIIAGSKGKTGAAILSAYGGLRVGAGLVTLCVPDDLNPIFESAIYEAMTVPLPNSKGWMSVQDYDMIKAAAEGKKAVVLGPGLGTAPETAELVIRLYRELTQPMVVDADALNILAADRKILKNPGGPRIMTPHPGEMSRLTGLSVSAIQADRCKAAKDLARESRACIILKGAATIIAAPDGNTAINPTGNPGMATGGMGDVLTGMIGGFLAQGLLPWQAVGLSVYLHGLAGDLAAAMGEVGYLAGELADEIPLAIQELSVALGNNHFS